MGVWDDGIRSVVVLCEGVDFWEDLQVICRTRVMICTDLRFENTSLRVSLWF